MQQHRRWNGGRINLTGQIADDTLYASNVGGIAQLGERLHGMQEVWGSSPHTSIYRTTVSQETVVFCWSAEIGGER